jgi:hypothetical protein
MIELLANDELERILKKAVGAELKYYSSNYLERPRKVTKHLSRDTYTPVSAASASIRIKA